MRRLTLYLDEETKGRVKEAARAAGISQSRWLANLVRERIAMEWPPSVIALAGAWVDMPTTEELRQNPGEDNPREPI